MTIEEKAKAYDEAIKIAKETYNTQPMYRNWLESMFPELQENEIKDMREKLIKAFGSIGKKEWGGVNVKDVIHWLEKQGEQNPTSDTRYEVKNGDSLSVNGKPFDYEHATITQKDFASVGETATIELSSPIDCGDRIYHVSHKPIEKNGEQKPVIDFKAKNWYVSKVDGKIHDMTYNPANKIESKVGEKIEDEIEVPFGAKDSELQEVTYYIPKGFHAEIDDDKVIIKKGEKLTAWSDKDEKMYKIALSCIETLEDISNGKNMHADVKDWLKSLKDRIGG